MPQPIVNCKAGVFYFASMPKKQFDHTDLQLLNILQKEGDITHKKLSKRTGLSIATVFKRIRKLKELDLLPNCFQILNKERLGYKLLHVVKMTIVDDFEKTASVEEDFVKDQHIEHATVVKKPELIGSLQYRLVVRHIDVLQFESWCKNYLEKHQAVLETEKVLRLIKSESHLKLTYHDLPNLKNLKD